VIQKMGCGSIVSGVESRRYVLRVGRRIFESCFLFPRADGKQGMAKALCVVRCHKEMDGMQLQMQ